jgi:hypothetical protein
MAALDTGILSLEHNRQLTSWFINDDPTTLVLTPHHQQFSGGAKKMVADPDRDPLTVKMIYPGGDGIVVTADSTTRRFDFIIVADYDAVIQIWDSFDRWKNHYVVEYVFPYNGYEVKVGGSSHGSEPDYG